MIGGVALRQGTRIIRAERLYKLREARRQFRKAEEVYLRLVAVDPPLQWSKHAVRLFIGRSLEVLAVFVETVHIRQDGSEVLAHEPAVARISQQPLAAPLAALLLEC